MGLFSTQKPRQPQQRQTNATQMTETTKLLLFSDAVQFADRIINSIGDKRKILSNFIALLPGYIQAEVTFIIVTGDQFSTVPDDKRYRTDKYLDYLDLVANRATRGKGYLLTQKELDNTPYLVEHGIRSAYASVFQDKDMHGYMLIESKDFRYLNQMKDELDCVTGYLESVLLSSSHYKNIEYEAKRDHLTGLFNRTSLEENVNKLSQLAVKNHKTLAYAMFDIDHFKSVNDTYGHQSGDLVLQFLAKMLLEYESDKVVPHRYGGEEFMYLLYDMTVEECVDLVESIRKRVESNKVKIVDGEINITISCGIHITGNPSQHYKKMIELADSNLYEAKETGRNKVVATTDI